MPRLLYGKIQYVHGIAELKTHCCMVKVYSKNDGTYIFLISIHNSFVVLVLQALSDNSSLTFVRPKWIFACHDRQKLVPSQPYIVAPS